MSSEEFDRWYETPADRCQLRLVENPNEEELEMDCDVQGTGSKEVAGGDDDVEYTDHTPSSAYAYSRGVPSDYSPKTP